MTSMLLALTLVAAPTDWLAAAEKQCFDLQYAPCLESLERAWVREGNSRAQVLRILELTGVTAAQLKQNARSQQGLRRLFLLDFDHKFAAKFAPRVNTQILEAKGWVAQVKPLAWSAADAELGSDAVKSIGVSVQNDPMSMAAGVRFHVRASGGPWNVFEAPLENGSARLAVNAAKIEWWAELQSGNHGVLAELGSDAAPQLAQVAPKVSLAPKSTPSGATTEVVTTSQVVLREVPRFRPAAWVATVLGVLSLGAGAAFGISSMSARTALMTPQIDGRGIVQNQTQAEANALNTQLRRDALVSTGLFIGGGVALAGGVTLFIIGSASPAREPTPLLAMRVEL
jgi:hypothetical protein